MPVAGAGHVGVAEPRRGRVSGVVLMAKMLAHGMRCGVLPAFTCDNTQEGSGPEHWPGRADALASTSSIGQLLGNGSAMSLLGVGSWAPTRGGRVLVSCLLADTPRPPPRTHYAVHKVIASWVVEVVVVVVLSYLAGERKWDSELLLVRTPDSLVAAEWLQHGDVISGVASD